MKAKDVKGHRVYLLIALFRGCANGIRYSPYCWIPSSYAREKCQ